MFYRQCSLLRLCLAGVLTAGICLPGCSGQEPVSKNDKGVVSNSNKAVKPERGNSRYENDLDRLDQLTSRINRACRGSYVVVFGAGDVTAAGRLVNVDYALFDRLSDNGAAVLIAESIAVGSRPSSQSQTQANTTRSVLEADEAVGSYIARAGFDPAGFTEWLAAKGTPAVNLQKNSVPEKMRIAAFIRGYGSASRCKVR